MRSEPSGKLTVSRARVEGAAIAAPTPCSAPRGEQPGLRLGEAAEHRGDGEQGDAGDEDLAAAEQVAHPGAEQQQPAEGERVDVLDPGEGGGGEAEVGADVRQRSDHHRGVEHHHQVAAEDDREDHRRVLGGSFAKYGRHWGVLGEGVKMEASSR